MKEAMRVVVALVAGAALLSSSADACSCATDKREPLDALESADAVFEGQVVLLRVEDSRQPRRKDGTRYPLTIEATLEVHRVWKGEVGPTTTVTTDYSGASCGYDFRLGGVYLVWGRRGRRSLEVGLCGRTKPFPYADKEASELGDAISVSSWKE